MKVESTIIHRFGASLKSVVETVDKMQAVKKADVRAGDWVCVKTRNSIYTIRVLGNGKYVASGGWFNRKGLSPMITTVSGCTWGGSAIKIDVVAACGLRLEFGNRLITSTIQKIFVLPYGCEN